MHNPDGAGKDQVPAIEHPAQDETLTSHSGGVINGGGESTLPVLAKDPVVTPGDETQRGGRVERRGGAGDGSGRNKNRAGDVSVGTATGTTSSGVSRLAGDLGHSVPPDQ